MRVRRIGEDTREAVGVWTEHCMTSPGHNAIGGATFRASYVGLECPARPSHRQVAIGARAVDVRRHWPGNGATGFRVPWPNGIAQTDHTEDANSSGR